MTSKTSFVHFLEAYDGAYDIRLYRGAFSLIAEAMRVADAIHQVRRADALEHPKHYHVLEGKESAWRLEWVVRGGGCWTAEPQGLYLFFQISRLAVGNAEFNPAAFRSDARVPVPR